MWLTKLGVSHDIVPELSCRVIPHELEQAELMVDYQEDGLVFVEAFELVGWLMRRHPGSGGWATVDE